jgi:glutamate formiminotransferase/formiminotetrahydrofolate cyclodeaminase
MSNPLVECVPNFSEARRPEVVAAIVKAITDVDGVHLLDQHSDIDHNRTVITFVGSPKAVEEAAFQSIAAAAGLIDLNQHSGEHPRMGAADVVPFIPISDVSMQECVEMARRLGKRVADELNIPVYLYEAAASRPERQNLENIRRGEFEGIKAEIGDNPGREPDFGPRELGSAGATVIGARQPLIAFNAYLTTADVEIAQKIAKAVRNSSGGLRFVKAIGLLVEGRAQVSMNLTDFRRTPVARVLEMIRSEAARYGVAVHHTELVGLLPQEALSEAAAWYLQLDDFKKEQVLENRIAGLSLAPGETSSNPYVFLDDLAAAAPTPGGGSAAAFSGAAAASLCAMVARLTVGKKKYADVETEMSECIEEAERLRKDMIALVETDAAAFDGIMTAFKLPKDTPEQQQSRTDAVENATLHAMEVPLETARKAVQTIHLALKLADKGNVNAISDAASGAAMARAALTAAGLNVRINANGLRDRTAAERFSIDVRALETEADRLAAGLRKILEDRGQISF